MKNFTFSLIFTIMYALSAYGQANPVTVTAYTKFGKPVEVLICAELTADERADRNDYVTTNFPNAEILEYSTSEYNCHGYAWLMQDGGAPGWINQDNADGSSNLCKFWTNDYYGETTEANAVKVFYYNGDHSAVPSPDVAGKYISKWGAGPLVLHSPDYCPYGSARKYYKKNNYISTDLSCSIWDRTVLVDEEANYYIDYNSGVTMPTGNTLQYVWSVYDNKYEENISEDLVSISSNGDNANITIHKVGIYIIRCNITTSYGENIVEYSMEAVIEN